jgi:ABC-type enterochelin transport system permease subunit
MTLTDAIVIALAILIAVGATLYGAVLFMGWLLDDPADKKRGKTVAFIPHEKRGL